MLTTVACGVHENSSIAAVSVRALQSVVSLGGPLELSIRFDVSDTLEPIDHDYWVMVHFLDTDGDLMWEADHQPVTPTTEWLPGQRVEYIHRLYVPMYPYIGNAVVAVGLYSTTTGTRLNLVAEDLGQRAYHGTVVAVRPQSVGNRLLYDDGWHDIEGDPRVNQHWRWTTDRATLLFRNPRSDAVLFLALDGRPDLFDTPQRAAIRLGDETVQEIVIDSIVPRFHEVSLTADQFGDDETLRMEFVIDRTFVPSEAPGNSSIDQRRLGIRVSYAFLESR